MPEILEVERYKRLAARTVGRRIAGVDTPDAWYLKHGADSGAVQSVAIGATVGGVRRIGKLLLVDLLDRPTLGLRFGMTGQLFVDGIAGLDKLEYGSSRVEPEWERFRLEFDDASRLVMHDPRRLGGLEIAPDESRLGVDALALTRDELAGALRAGRGPLKARLMDQSRIAGMGNLLTDESLWRARLSPRRVAGDLSDQEITRLHATMHEVLRELGERGGSHTGDLQVARTRGAACPRCGSPMRCQTTGGRSTYWCAACVSAS